MRGRNTGRGKEPLRCAKILSMLIVHAFMIRAIRKQSQEFFYPDNFSLRTLRALRDRRDLFQHQGIGHPHVMALGNRRRPGS